MTDLQALHDSTHTMVMGVLNITEDSVSDGGLWLDPAKAAQHGRDMMAAGADIIDIGAESTRPGAKRVSEADELARITGAVKTLIPAGAVPASRTTESPALTIDAAALAMACFSARLRCIFSWVVGWVGINRLRVTPPCVRLITPCSSSFIRSRRIVAGDALVTATSSSTVTRLWLFR